MWPQIGARPRSTARGEPRRCSLCACGRLWVIVQKLSARQAYLHYRRQQVDDAVPQGGGHAGSKFQPCPDEWELSAMRPARDPTSKPTCHGFPHSELLTPWCIHVHVQGVAGRFAQGGGGVAGWRLQAAAPCGDYAAAGAHTLDEISAVRGRFRMFLSSLGRPRCVR